jgi:hypothetical protein
MRHLVGLTLAVCLSAASVFAQDVPQTRAEADRQAREQKQRDGVAYKPNTFERAMDFAEDRAVFLLDREGFYPKLGSLSVASGFAYGLGFRDRDLFGQRGTFDLWGAASIKRYLATEARFRLPALARNRFLAEGWVSRRENVSDDFFGLGPDSERSDHTNFALRTTQVGGRAGVRPAPVLLVGGEVEFLRPRTGRGRAKNLPSTEDVFDESEAPGLNEPVNFLRSTAFVEVDYREPKNARQGGFYRFDFSRFDDRTLDRFTHDRASADLRQYFGFLAGRRVIATRLFASTSTAEDGREVPFYLMPALGGNDLLRGFRNYRFRGPHALVLSGEYRWEIWSGLDAALFYDTGKVANRRADLDFSNLESAYGFGFRFNTDNGVIFRVDAAFGSRDGKHLYIVFGGIF